MKGTFPEESALHRGPSLHAASCGPGSRGASDSLPSRRSRSRKKSEATPFEGGDLPGPTAPDEAICLVLQHQTPSTSGISSVAGKTAVPPSGRIWIVTADHADGRGSEAGNPQLITDNRFKPRDSNSPPAPRKLALGRSNRLRQSATKPWVYSLGKQESGSCGPRSRGACDSLPCDSLPSRRSRSCDNMHIRHRSREANCPVQQAPYAMNIGVSSAVWKIRAPSEAMRDHTIAEIGL